MSAVADKPRELPLPLRLAEDTAVEGTMDASATMAYWGDVAAQHYDPVTQVTEWPESAPQMVQSGTPCCVRDRFGRWGGWYTDDTE